MPMGFTPGEFLGGIDTVNQQSAIEAVQAAQDYYAGKEEALWDKIVDTAKQIIPKALSSAQAAMAQLSYSGSTGDFISNEENITLTGKFFRLVEQYPEKIGSPLHKADYINTFTGFVQCRNAVFSATTATVTEENAIEEMLNSGIFFE